MSGDKRTIQLLWTAGWDSTFRLLMALRVYRIAVQPYYLIHFTRRSTANELRAMQQISRGITARYPELAGLLHQPIISTVAEIGADPVITGRFERLRTRSHLGEQYDWLARFASQRNLSDARLLFTRMIRQRFSSSRMSCPMKSRAIAISDCATIRLITISGSSSSSGSRFSATRSWRCSGSRENTGLQS